MTNPPILQLRVALTTSDYERLVKFYCDGLGLEPARVSRSGKRSILRKALRKSASRITTALMGSGGRQRAGRIPPDRVSRRRFHRPCARCRGDVERPSRLRCSGRSIRPHGPARFRRARTSCRPSPPVGRGEPPERCAPHRPGTAQDRYTGQLRSQLPILGANRGKGWFLESSRPPIGTHNTVPLRRLYHDHSGQPNAASNGSSTGLDYSGDLSRVARSLLSVLLAATTQQPGQHLTDRPLPGTLITDH